MDWLSNLIAAVALVVSGFSFWFAKTGPRRARQAALRDELRREVSAFLRLIEQSASQARRGEELSDISAELSLHVERVAEFRDRLEVPGLNVFLLKTDMFLYKSEWFGLRSHQTQVESLQAHLRNLESRESQDDVRETYVSQQRVQLQKFERALPGAIAAHKAEAERVSTVLNRALAALNREDKK